MSHSIVSKVFRFLILAAAALPCLYAQDSASLIRQMLDRIVAEEHAFVDRMKGWDPIVETYLQEMPEGEGRSFQDHYFLGRLSAGSQYTSLLARGHQVSGGSAHAMRGRRAKPIVFLPEGLAQMFYLDATGFDQSNYAFEYVRREFLGELRCLVFDISPLDKKARGRFIGRIWVEDREFNVVRSNGTYTNSTSSRLFFHFDSWRVNVAPKIWAPAYIYVEEAGTGGKSNPVPKFKGQTRLWAYNATKKDRLEELTSILVESQNPVKDQSEGKDASPLESQRSCERQAEENIIQRLEKAGLIAAKGEVDTVMNTVVNNLIVTNNLTIDAQCRVLLTTPLESFAIGHTIVVSRGLLDVLPDEASLGLVLADELAHIALGHRTNTQFAFTNQTMMSDDEMLQKFRFQRNETEIAAAGKKAIEILAKSPYSQKLGTAGLFLRSLGENVERMPKLIRANLGNQLGSLGTLERFAELIRQAPQLEQEKLEQIAALPIGSRIKLDPWTNQITMLKNRPVSLLSSREKMLFEVSPFLLNLTRVEAVNRP